MQSAENFSFWEITEQSSTRKVEIAGILRNYGLTGQPAPMELVDEMLSLGGWLPVELKPPASMLTARLSSGTGTFLTYCPNQPCKQFSQIYQRTKGWEIAGVKYWRPQMEQPFY